MNPDLPIFRDHDVECGCGEVYAPAKIYTNPFEEGAYFVCPACGGHDHNPTWNPPLTAWDYVMAEHRDG